MLRHIIILIIIAFSIPVFSQTDPELFERDCNDGKDDDLDGLIDCDDPDCYPFIICAECLIDSLSFADSYIFQFQPCADTTNLYQNPHQILGAPDYDGFSQDGKFLSVGNGGYIILQFEDNYLVNSGTAEPDFAIFEIGADKESVYFSLRPADQYTRQELDNSGLLDTDDDGFWEFDISEGGYSAFDIDSYFDKLYLPGRLRFDGVILEDDGDSSCTGSSPGADIDAVCCHFLYAQEICDNGFDDDNDGLTDSEDPDCSCSLDTTLQLSEVGHPCSSEFHYRLDTEAEYSLQWFHDGLPVSGATNAEFYPNGNVGFYELVVVDGVGDCFISEQLVYSDVLVADTMQFSICPGDSIQVLDTVLRINGMYQFDLGPFEQYCDSILFVNLSYYDDYYREFDRILCEGDSLFFDGTVIKEAGIFTSEYTTTNGCDSINVINVTVRERPSDTISVALCPGDSFEFYGRTFTEPGLYFQSVNVVSDCDSLIVLSLELLPEPGEQDTSILICSGDTLLFEGLQITEPGSYIVSALDEYCLNYKLGVLAFEPEEIDTTLYICPGDIVAVGSEFYNTSGTYNQLIESTDLCDTILNINIIARMPAMGSLERTICEGESLNVDGVDYSSPGVYQLYFEDAASNGCDSLLNLILNVVDTMHVNEQYILCAGDQIEVEGTVIDQEGQYVFDIFDNNNCLIQRTVQIEINPNCETCFLPVDSGSSKRSSLLIEILDGSYYKIQLNQDEPDVMDDQELDAFLMAYLTVKYHNEKKGVSDRVEYELHSLIKGMKDNSGRHKEENSLGIKENIQIRREKERWKKIIESLKPGTKFRDSIK